MSKVGVIEASIARNNFAKLSRQAKKAPVKVTRHGRVEFVVISPDLFETVEATGAVTAGELERMQASFKEMCRGMQSEQSSTAYDMVAALSVEQLPRTVTEAFRRMQKPEGRRSGRRIGG